MDPKDEAALVAKIEKETEARLAAEAKSTKMQADLASLQTQFAEQKAASEASIAKLTEKPAGEPTPDKDTTPTADTPLIPEVTPVDYAAKTKALADGIPADVAVKVNEAAANATPAQKALMAESAEGKYEFLKGILGGLGFEEKAPVFLDQFNPGSTPKVSVRERAATLFATTPANVSGKAFNGMSGVMSSPRAPETPKSSSMFDGLKRAAVKLTQP